MNTDIVVSLLVLAGIIFLGAIGGFILGRITCSCRKVERCIKQYREECGEKD
jgi:hypothetical protein